MRILSIDPGPTMSAWAKIEEFYDGNVGEVHFGICKNEDLFYLIGKEEYLALVIERIASFGMPVGQEIFDTCYWSGRFQQAYYAPDDVQWVFRKEVKLHLCGSPRAKDANIRQAIIDRFGGLQATKKGGPLHKCSKDMWAAIAVGLTWMDTKGKV